MLIIDSRVMWSKGDRDNFRPPIHRAGPKGLPNDPGLGPATEAGAMRGDAPGRPLRSIRSIQSIQSIRAASVILLICLRESLDFEGSAGYRPHSAPSPSRSTKRREAPNTHES